MKQISTMKIHEQQQNGDRRATSSLRDTIFFKSHLKSDLSNMQQKQCTNTSSFIERIFNH